MLARQFFGKENPLGRLLHLKGRHGKLSAWSEACGGINWITAHSQGYFARTCFPWQTTVVVRTKGPPFAVAPDVRRAVHEFDPDLPVAKLDTLEQTVADSLKVRKIMLVLLAIFALTALVLACVGIYGVISYSVAQRTREVGIRVALGADSSRVVRLILGPGGKAGADWSGDRNSGEPRCGPAHRQSALWCLANGSTGHGERCFPTARGRGGGELAAGAAGVAGGSGDRIARRVELKGWRYSSTAPARLKVLAIVRALINLGSERSTLANNHSWKLTSPTWKLPTAASPVNVYLRISGPSPVTRKACSAPRLTMSAKRPRKLAPV